MHILLVEDHLQTALSIQHVLRHYYSITHAASRTEASQYLQSRAFDACIIDLHLPDGNGFELLKNFSDRTLPILILSGQSDTQTKVSTLKSGASDFLSKPFAMSELAVRMDILLQKRQALQRVFAVKNIEFSPTERRVSVAETSAQLTKSEAALLTQLFHHRGNIVEKEYLLGKDCANIKQKNAVEALIKNLRKKLTNVGLAKCIETVYGEGYRLNV